MFDPAKRRFGRTGADGKAIFNDLPPGPYMVTLDRMENPSLINPSANPYAPPPLFTLPSDKETVSIAIELWRGVFRSGEVLVDRGGIPGTKAVLRSPDGAAAVGFPLGVTGRAEHLLVPGRFEAELEFPAGYLLVDLVRNGESLPGHTARLDVTDDTRGQYLTWSLSAPCLITGRISIAGGSGCTGTVVATLDEPGSWYPAAMARGGSQFQRVPARTILPDCSYLLRLPDGGWAVLPEGGEAIGSTPESVDVTLAPGDAQTANFLLETDEDYGKKRNTLRVDVRSPDERALGGAVVEVWPAGEPHSGASPLRSAKTEPSPSHVEFRGLPAGDYLVVAGRADYPEGTARVQEFDPTAKKPTDVTVTLRDLSIVVKHPYLVPRRSPCPSRNLIWSAGSSSRCPRCFRRSAASWTCTLRARRRASSRR